MDTGGDEFGLSTIDEEGYKQHAVAATGRPAAPSLQWMAERGTWLDVIGAVRYDGYQHGRQRQ